MKHSAVIVIRFILYYIEKVNVQSLTIIDVVEHDYDSCSNVLNVNKRLTDPLKCAILWLCSQRRPTHKTS